MDFSSKAPGSSQSQNMNAASQIAYMEVYNLFKALGIKISSEKDLQKPDIDIFRSILLESAMISQLNMNDSCSELSEYSLVFELMRVVGIDDFTTMDLISVEPKKMKKVYFGIYQYLKYRNSVYSSFEDLLAKIRDIANINTRISKDLEKHKENYQSICAKKEKEKHLFDEKMETINNYKHEVDEEIDKIKEYQIENDDIQKDLSNNLEIQAQRLRDEIEKIQVELNKKVSMIVKSPERKKKKQEELTKDVQKENEHLRRLDEEISLKNMKISCLVKVRNKVTRLRNWVKEAYQRKETEEILKKELQELKIKLINLDATQEKLSRELNNLTWELKSLEDTKLKQEETVLRKEENHKESIKHSADEYNRKFWYFQESHTKFTSLLKEKDEIRRGREQIRQSFETEMADYISFYTALRESFTSYKKKISVGQNFIEEEIADL